MFFRWPFAREPNPNQAQQALRLRLIRSVQTRETCDNRRSLEASRTKFDVSKINESRYRRIGGTCDRRERPKIAIECGAERRLPIAESGGYGIERRPDEARQRRSRQRAEIGRCIGLPGSFAR